MHYIQDLIREFAWVNVASMGVVGDIGYVERADVRYVWETLEEMMLPQSLVYVFTLLESTTYPIFVVNRHRQFSKAGHTSASDETEDFTV